MFPDFKNFNYPTHVAFPLKDSMLMLYYSHHSNIYRPVYNMFEMILLTNLKWSLWIPDDQVCIITRSQAALQTVKTAELGCFLAEELNYIWQRKASLTGWSPEQRQTCEWGSDGCGLMSGKQAAQQSAINDNLMPNVSLTCFSHLFTPTGVIVKERFTSKNLFSMHV